MSNEIKVLGPHVGYVDIIDYSAEEKLKAEAAKAPTRYPLSPSQAGACTRELAYKLSEYLGQNKYEKPAQTAEQDRIFSAGHSLEYMLVRKIKELCSEFFEIRYAQQMLSFVRLEHPTEPQLNKLVEGSLDACFISKDYKGIIDFKTKKDKFSSYFKSSWDEQTEKLKGMASVQQIGESGKAFWVEDLEAFLEELNDPFFESNFLQLNYYANTQFIQERGIDHGAIIQLNKNDKRLREVRFKPSLELVKKVDGKFRAAYQAAAVEKDPELAPRDHIIGSIKCAFCDYKKTCWKFDDPADDPLKAYFKSMPDKKEWPKDLDRMPKEIASKISRLYKKWSAAVEKTDEAEDLEKQLIRALTDAGVRKVRMEDTKIFELKHLKSPQPHLELRRSKV
jgi:hypothetical protein